jgi:PTS system mannose-specific IIA component/PTS system mannose-specific IIB component
LRDFRIVVAAHSGLAAALVRSAELICGELRDVTAVGIAPSDSPETFAAELRRAIDLDARPVLVLTDLDGGTPSIVAATIAAERPGTSVLAGVTLGILVEAATGPDGIGDGAVERLVETGRAGIVDVTARLAARGRS